MRLEAAVSRLPRLAILILLAVPFAVAEPAKIVGLVLLGRGQVAAGLVVLALAYLASFVLVERIYQAGRDKLLTYPWLKRIVMLLALLRLKTLAFVRFNAIKARIGALRERVRRWWRGD